jgi:hypothetical protein
MSDMWVRDLCLMKNLNLRLWINVGRKFATEMGQYLVSLACCLQFL